MRALALLLPMLMLGCPKFQDDPDLDADTDTDTDSDTDADADADTDADADSDADTDTDAGDSGATGDSGGGGDSGGTGLIPNCPDDMLEDNDSLAMPTTGLTSATMLQSLDNDDDWFEIDVPANAIVEVEIFFDDSLGDIDLTLTDDVGTVLDGSYSVSDNELVIDTNNTGTATTWYAHVYMFTNNGCNDYDIEIRVGVLGPEICDDLFDNDEDGGADCDDYECLGEPACLQACPNEDIWETNDSLLDAATGFTSDVDLMVHPQNEDWFEIEVAHDELASVVLDHDALIGRVDVYLVDANGATLDSDTTTNPTKAAQALNTSGNTETWFARVATNDSCNNYDLELTTGPIPDEDCDDTFDNDLDTYTDCDDYDCLTDLNCPNTCPPEDALEDNDTQGMAWVGAGTENGLMVHVQDEDFFELVVGPGEIGQVDVLLNNADGDIDLQLLDENGDVVDASGSTSNAESVFVVNDTPDPQTYVARVFVWGGSSSDCNTYDLVLYTGPIPDETCDDQVDNDLDNLSDCQDYDCIDDAACTAVCAPEDALEDNDDQASALPLVGTGPFTIHAQDDDWFSIDVPDGEQAIVSLSHDHQIAVIDVRLYDENDVLIDSDLSTTSDDKEVSGVNSTGSDATWTVEVVHWTGAPCNTYTLDADVAPVPPEACDDTTDNDLDTYTDCDDYDCVGEPVCAGECPDEDAFGGVNADSAVALPIPSGTDLSTHVQRPDWFRATVSADELLTIDVTFVHADGNLAVDVFDLDEQLVQTVDTFSDDEQVLVVNDSPDTVDYLIQVRTSGSAICNSFDYATTVGPLPDEICDDSQDNDFDTWIDCDDYDCGIGFAGCNCPADDAYEPNDTAAAATTGVLTETGLQVFKQNPDFYAYTVADGQTIDILVSHLVANGDIDFFLRDVDSNVLVQGFTGSDDESGSWINNTGAPVDVTLEISVWPSDTDGYCNDYDLTVTLTP